MTTATTTTCCYFEQPKPVVVQERVYRLQQQQHNPLPPEECTTAPAADKSRQEKLLVDTLDYLGLQIVGQQTSPAAAAGHMLFTSAANKPAATMLKVSGCKSHVCCVCFDLFASRETYETHAKICCNLNLAAPKYALVDSRNLHLVKMARDYELRR